MADYSHQEISKLINNIKSGKLILPAIQRNFVWPEDKVCKLFDSLMHDYPIGTFLFWEVDKSVVGKYTFNEFIDSYNEQNEIQRGKKVKPTRDEYTGVLDGQQRITSLYIGLCGKYRTRLKGKKKHLDSSYVEKYLCLDLLHGPNEETDEYSFCFVTADKIGKKYNSGEPGSEDEFWVKLADVFDKDFNAFTYMADVEKNHFDKNMEYEKRTTATNMLMTLHNAIFVKSNVNFYPAEQKDLAEVVDIFVRVNSGGQKLSASDLMLSIATGEQEDEDIHKKIQEAIESIAAVSSNEENAFQADKELILTAGLLFTGAEKLSLQKKENYSRQRINEILNHWDDIIEALCIAAEYVEHIGFLCKKLTSKNLILPVAYYFYKNPTLGHNHRKANTPRAKKDRIFIRQWLLRAMINSIFRDGTGATLLSIRHTIDSDKRNYFPLDMLMESESKRSLKISDDTIEEMLEYKYGDVRIEPLQIEMTQGYYGADHNIDHIWPKAVLKSMKELKKLLPNSTEADRQQFKDNCDKFANLELLSTAENQTKLANLFDSWVKTEHSDPGDRYYDVNSIPKDVEYDFGNFIAFLDAREEILKQKIKATLPESFDDIVERYNLGN